jgi:RES domain-containing protein
MIVFRVADAKFKETTLSGIGAERFGGRWNEVGTPAVYCSENVSLALLEYYVNSASIEYLPKSILVAKIRFPDEFPIEELSPLPIGWNQYPYSFEGSRFFTDLTKKPDFFALKVPSSIVGIESNYVLNPLYKDFEMVEIIEFMTLPIDERLRI